MNKKNKKIYWVGMIGQPILSALFLYLALPNAVHDFGISFLGLIFAVPLFFFLDSISSRTGRVFLSFTWGVLLYSLLVSWFVQYSLIGYFVFVLFLSVQAFIFGLLYPSKDFPIWMRSLYVASCWVFSEMFRAFVMKGFSWGIGHGIAYLPFVPIVSVIGSLGVSFLVIFVNDCIYLALKGKRSFFVSIVALVLVVLASLTLFHMGIMKRQDAVEMRVAIIQPKVDCLAKMDIKQGYEVFEKHYDLTRKEVPRNSVDWILWPETSVPFDFTKDRDVYSKLRGLAREYNAFFMFGAALEKRVANVNAAILFGPSGDLLDIYEKRYLVPFSEYVPRKGFLGMLRGLFSTDKDDFIPGESNNLLNALGQKIGVLICSEDTLRPLFLDYAKQKVRAIFVLLNDGWFKSKAGMMLHAQHSVIHSVEAGVAVVRVSNSGLSGVIEPTGFVLDKGFDSLGKEAVLIQNVRLHQHQTFYGKHGKYFSLFYVLSVIIGVVIQKKRYGYV